MIEQLSLQTVLTYLTLISVPIGVLYHIMTLRNANRARKAQMFNALNQTMTNFDGWLINRDLMYMEWKDYEDFERKYGSDHNPEAYAKRLASWFWMNNLGIMLKEGLINTEMVYDTFGSTIIMSWRKWELIIREQRIRYMGQNWMEHWEFLAFRMADVQQQRGIAWKAPETGLRYVSNPEA